MEKEKVLILLFSGTGNTRAVGAMIAGHFRDKGFSVEKLEIKNPFPEIKDPDDYRFIGFGYPVHAFNIPRIFRRFLATLPKTSKAKAFIFKTAGEPLAFNSASSFVLARTLRKKGYEVVSDALFLMPYNIMFRFPDPAVKAMVRKAEDMSAKLVENLVRGKYEKVRFKKRYLLVATILRIQYLGASLNGMLCRADGKKCNRCLKCVRSCPTGNIALRNGKIKFSGKCTMCMRCTMMCPNDAIRFGLLNRWKVNGRYDFERIVNDDAIPDDFFEETQSRFFRWHRKYYHDLEEKEKSKS